MAEIRNKWRRNRMFAQIQCIGNRPRYTDHADFDQAVVRKTATKSALRVKFSAEASIVLPGYTAFSDRSEVVKAEIETHPQPGGQPEAKLSAGRVDSTTIQSVTDAVSGNSISAGFQITVRDNRLRSSIPQLLLEFAG